MTKMLRKQFYINRRQEAILKRLARLRSISESEIVRRAIEREADQPQPLVTQFSHTAWEEILQLVEERQKLGSSGEPYRWNRQEIYDECEK